MNHSPFLQALKDVLDNASGETAAAAALNVAEHIGRSYCFGAVFSQQLSDADGAKVCPFCGNTELVVDHSTTINLRDAEPMIEIAVQCDTCGAKGPNRGTADEAVIAWNELHEDS